MSADKNELVFAIIIAGVIFFILAAFIVLIVYNLYRVKFRKSQDILRAVYNAEESERTRIAGELHDDVGARLSALKLNNELMTSGITNEEMLDVCDKSGDLIDRVVTDLRVIIRNQSSTFIVNNGLKSELEYLKEQFEQKEGIEISLELEQVAELENDFELGIFRIIQELLNNSVKHSECTVAKIAMRKRNNALELYYADNGIGYKNDNVAIKGLGLKNIFTRIELYGGTCKFKSVPDVETSYTILFPLQNITPLTTNVYGRPESNSSR